MKPDRSDQPTAPVVYAHGEPGPPSQSPYVWNDMDYLGRVIQISVEHDNVTRVITAVNTYRDIGCVFKKILVGLGDDGIPDHTGHAFTAPTGTHAIPVAQFNAQGFTTIEQFQALQITAGR